MTVITGTVEDIGMEPLSGVLVATSVEFRTSGDIIIAPESRTYPIAGGIVSADLIPGPTRLTIQVGSHARDSFDVIVPDEPVTLARLIEDAFEWTPSVVSAVAAHRQAAESAAAAAAQSASDADGSATAAAGSASAAAGSASDAASSASAAGSSAGAAAGSASDAADSAAEAVGSASAAASSAGAAAGSASDASQSAQDASSSASAAAGSATDADGHANRAEAAADSFGLSATSSTLAPGSAATVTVSGDGPAYTLAFGVPQGEKGDPGTTEWGGLSGTPDTFPPTAHTHPVTDLTATGRTTSNYLRGDGTWATPTNTTYSVPTQAEAEAGTANTGRAFSAQRVRQAIDARAVTRQGSTQGLWIGTTATLPATGTAGVLYVTYE